MSDQGNFVLQSSQRSTADQIQWSDARICFGISDFKGIEEKTHHPFQWDVITNFHPGLPAGMVTSMKKDYLHPFRFHATDIGKPVNYQMNIKIKGSEMLHFVPLSGNSHYTLESTWPNPSFDGSNLPSERTVTKNGFTAAWNFNKANLPFGTVLNDFKFDHQPWHLVLPWWSLQISMQKQTAPSNMRS